MSATTTVNQVPSVWHTAECDEFPPPPVRKLARARCPDCAAVITLDPCKLLRVANYECYECPLCSIGSLRAAWEKNIVSVKP